MSKVNDIRRLRGEGETVAAIARKVGVSRDTVYKYLSLGDLSPKAPVRGVRRSRLDPYRPLIEHWLDEDRESWRKQRHTAHRVTTNEELSIPTNLHSPGAPMNAGHVRQRTLTTSGYPSLLLSLGRSLSR